MIRRGAERLWEGNARSVTTRVALVTATLAVACGTALPSVAQMMSARSMSGLPRQVDDLPAGTVVVRVVRDELTNYVAGQRVDLTTGGRAETRTTDAEGRAEFTGVPAGTPVHAVTTVDGQRLESQRFEMPAGSGVRLLLVAVGVGATADRASREPGAATAGAVAGTVTLGRDSRVVVQLADDQLEVFYLFDVVNAGPAQAATGPLVFEMPPEATSVAVLEASSPQAEAAGRTVTVRGPFAPGITSVQMAYNLAAPGGRATVRQRLPITLQQLALFVQRVPGVTLSSTQVGDQRETVSGGRSFIVALGPAVKAGDAIVFELGGLPHRSMWPRNLALGIALVVLAAGAWGVIRGPASGGATVDRRYLEARRELLFGQLLALDRQESAGALDAVAAARGRTELLGELERVFGMLDMVAGPPADERGPAA